MLTDIYCRKEIFSKSFLQSLSIFYLLGYPTTDWYPYYPFNKKFVAAHSTDHNKFVWFRIIHTVNFMWISACEKLKRAMREESIFLFSVQHKCGKATEKQQQQRTFWTANDSRNAACSFSLARIPLQSPLFVSLLKPRMFPHLLEGSGHYFVRLFPALRDPLENRYWEVFARYEPAISDLFVRYTRGDIFQFDWLFLQCSIY